jgi:hypothetical protein
MTAQGKDDAMTTHAMVDEFDRALAERDRQTVRTTAEVLLKETVEAVLKALDLPARDRAVAKATVRALRSAGWLREEPSTTAVVRVAAPDPALSTRLPGETPS